MDPQIQLDLLESSIINWKRKVAVEKIEQYKKRGVQLIQTLEAEKVNLRSKFHPILSVGSLQITTVIGQGGFGVVWKVRNNFLFSVYKILCHFEYEIGK